MVEQSRKDVWTYASATSVTTPGNLTGTYWPGMLIALKQGTVKYFVIESVTYNSPNTTIVLDGLGVYSLTSAAITAHIDTVGTPKGFPNPLYVLVRNGNASIAGMLGLGGITSPEEHLHLPTEGAIFFADNGTISSLDSNHQIFFDRSNNVLEFKEYGGIYFSADLPNGNRSIRFTGQGNAYFGGNVSALSFTDRTPGYRGDALSEIRKIKNTIDGKIDHATLPEFARKTKIHRNIKGVETVEDQRDIGAMISILTKAVQELDAKIVTKDNQIVALLKRIEALEAKVGI